MSLSTVPNGALTIAPIASLSLAGAEIAAFDKASARLFVTSNSGLSVVSLANPAAPALIATLDFTTPAYGFATTDVTSVAVSGGLVAVALPDADKTANGQVLLLDAATGALLRSVTVGALPDSLTFTPDGTKVLVANEGEYTATGPGGKGSVSIIDLSGGVAAATVRTAGFEAFDGQEAALRAAGVRIFQGVSVSDDVEPEYIAVAPDGLTAMVTLQEANAVALLDIASATITAIVPLGTKDFSGLLADFSDRDGPGNAALVKLTTGNPVSGLYMPDAISAYAAGGATYYVIANEGDDRDDFLNPDETIRLGNAGYDLDNARFPNEAALKANAALGRLTVSNAPGLRGDTDGDGDIDRILAYGARSFSILDSTGAIVFDSADIIERIAAMVVPAATFDDRSDNKGPEPEGVTVGEIGGRIYAFVGLERSHLTLAFDVTDPLAVAYAGMANRPGDLNPEGGLFISAADSPTGSAIFVSTNEVSNNISIFSVAPSAPFTLQLLHFADAEAGLLAGRTAPYLAALVDAFDGLYANTLILAGGDNFIPGPFLAAGTDPSVQAIHGLGDNPAAADIAIHNRIGVQASTLGNHEFDLGTRALSDAILDANFPYLSANLDFSADPDIAGRYLETVGTGGLEDIAALARRIVPSAVATYGTERIGLVGATTQILETISSTGRVEVKGFAGDGAETNDMALLAGQLQIVIDDLRVQGVNKIILMAHLQQIAFEIALAPLLSGVDVILAAGSNTRLGDATDVAVAFPGHAADFAGPYPIVTFGADGDPTLIVNTDNEFTYLGRLVLTFDAQGRVITDSLDPTLNGAYAATAANVAAAWGVEEADLATTAFAAGTKGAAVQEITDAVQAVINAKDGQVWGFTRVYLEGERNLVRNQETNLGNITADANKVAAEAALGDGSFVASLKNGGGIRAQVGATVVSTGEKIPPIANPDAGKPAGGISQLDIENALRFDNKLMVFDTSAAGLKAILEHGVASLGNQGRFPQLGGVAFSYDPSLPAGSRVLSIGLVDEAGKLVAKVVENGAVSAEAPALIRLVTLSFLAQGGDGYPMKANGENFRFLLADGTLSAAVGEALDFTNAAAAASVGVTLADILGEQQAFRAFLEARHATPQAAYDVAETPLAGDTRIQNLAARGDTVLDGLLLEGANAAETLDGSAGADTILGLGGDDVIAAGGDADRVDGGAGNDLVLGQGGADSLAGGNGADTLDGGAGADTLDGGNTGDLLLGAEGNDLLLGGNGADTLDGGPGADTMAGGLNSDIYRVDNAGDIAIEGARGGFDRVVTTLASTTLADHVEALELGAGALEGIGNATGNLLVGNALGNVLAGLGGADTLQGGGGEDLLLGGLGADRIEGGAGADTIEGGNAADTLIGGEGADIFRFTAHTDSYGTTRRDVIEDFVRGEDRILLDFDANGHLPGTQGFAFTAGGFIQGRPGFIRVEAAGANEVLVLASINGNTAAEFALLVRGAATLDASDFIL